MRPRRTEAEWRADVAAEIAEVGADAAATANLTKEIRVAVDAHPRLARWLDEDRGWPELVLLRRFTDRLGHAGKLGFWRPGPIGGVGAIVIDVTRELPVDSYFHELGHDTHLRGLRPSPIDTMITHAFETATTFPAEMMRTNPREYFAEAFMADMQYGRALRRIDPHAYKLVRNVLAEMGVE